MSMALLAAAGCPSSREAEIKESLRRQEEVERRLRAENHELSREIRGLKAKLGESPGETEKPAAQGDPRDARIAELSEQIRRIQADLDLAREENESVESIAETAQGFLEAVMRADLEGIAGRVDWEGMADETLRRGTPPKRLADLPDRKRAALLAETRKKFLEEFSGKGAGRAVWMENAGKFGKGDIESGIARVVLGEDSSGTTARWSLLLRKSGKSWKVVGVLHETLELPAEVPGSGSGEEQPGTGGE